MTQPKHDEHSTDGAGDRALVERIDALYEPAKLTPAARYALERELWTRIERGRRPALFRPALAMVTVVATVLWFARPPTDSDTLTMAAAVVDAWEYDVLFSDSLEGESFDWSASAGLPEEYVSIEALLEGDESDEGNEGNEK
jgi:hypothetical protein